MNTLNETLTKIATAVVLTCLIAFFIFVVFVN